MNLSRFLLTGLALGAAVALSAKVVTKPVAYEHAGVKLEGYLAYDDEKVSDAKKAPGVLVVPEWWGLNDYAKSRADQLAQLGYVAFAADMYGAGVVTTDAKKAQEFANQFYGKPLMAERARAGLDQLLATGLVVREKVAAIGFCFGGSTSLILAYSGAPLAGVVSFHGSPFAAPSAAYNKVKILMLNGAADGFVPPEEITDFKKAMSEHHYDWQWIDYAYAVHAFSNPGADKLGAANGLPIAYNEPAARRAWQHMQMFLKEVFGQ